MTAILGLSAYYHDSAAALVVDGDLVAAAQEERFSRIKHDQGFPERAVASCLEQAGLTVEDLDFVVFYDKPLAKFDRLLETYLAFAPRGFGAFLAAMPSWLHQKLHLPREIRQGLGGRWKKRVLFTDHHQSHAASAFFPSPFEEAALLTFDGVGEWATASWGVGRGNRVELAKAQHFPHSLGLLYSAFTYFTGFAVNSDEYKLMGLAPYGEPTYLDLFLEHIVDLKEDGSLWLDQRYFNYCHGLTMTSAAMDRLLGGPPRRAGEPITEREMNLAATVQRLTEEVMLRAARHVHAQTGLTRLCLAGGVALNCVANGRILREGPFEEIWIQPASDDAGGALGAALFVWHQLLGNERVPRRPDSQHASLLGPAWGDGEIRSFLESTGAPFEAFEADEPFVDRVAEVLAEGRVVGWYQGRMEFGPRALGSRSILGDPRVADMQSRINKKVKFREGFRPFAPVVLEEKASEYFDLAPGVTSPYMLLVAPVAEAKMHPLSEEDLQQRGIDKLKVLRSEIPSVTHVDGSARVQTVPPDSPELYRRLLERFEAKTGCPVLVNTSFNLGWEPIVESPRQAFETFMSCELDALAIGRHLLLKEKQPGWIAAAARVSPVAGIEDLLASPCCGAALELGGDALGCAACGRSFPLTDGIPQLFWPHEKVGQEGDVTEQVKAFYEDNPFPNYDEHDSLRSLIDKSRRGVYGRKLFEAIPANASVLEVGCGTGQLTNFLAIGCRRVVGADLCLNSLRLGEAFRQREGLHRARFLQMNLFRPTFRPESFDVVMSNGVLHHTSDPRGGFEGLVKLVKPGGYFVVGLYNTWGRLATDARRLVLGKSGSRFHRLDPYLRSTRMSEAKQRAWLADQYRHPHESKHTMGEVLDWFAGTGLSFVRGVPAVDFADEPLENVDLLDPAPPGGKLARAVAQLRMIRTGNREGGFFVMIGRRLP
ncbi:MAG TPA: carbamoyltransferase N-terminal domain-containing protein [Thermoanaerobaculia bacterium]|nr:carbamoyltransferase N-terminal domain-containing protein [Thermoanaerobaculia bacterium]